MARGPVKISVFNGVEMERQGRVMTRNDVEVDLGNNQVRKAKVVFTHVSGT